MDSDNLLTATQSEPPALGRHYGSCDGKAALARETSPGNWQVKVRDPINRLAGHDGWMMLGTGWSTLDEARKATGLS